MTKLFHLKETEQDSIRQCRCLEMWDLWESRLLQAFFPKGILYISVFTIIDQFMLWTLGVKFTTPQGEGKFNPKEIS